VHPWTDPEWLAEANAWIDLQVTRLGRGPITAREQFHVRPWSTVIRLHTPGGDLYFKANMPQLRFEAGLVTRLAARRPDLVPPLPGVDLERGWMLMEDAGVRLRELVERERDLSPWLDILRLYAELQVGVIHEGPQFVELGVPDLGLTTLPARYAVLLDDLEELDAEELGRFRAALPRVEELAEELAAYGLPETIQHDDFHDGQVFVRDGRYLLMDWGDSCVSHPFFTLSVSLEGVVAWGLDDVQGSVDLTPFLDAYLEPFRKLAPDVDLVAAATTAMRLGWACRAVNGHLPFDEPSTHGRLRMFVDGKP
jgi:hypothetical protein